MLRAAARCDGVRSVPGAIATGSRDRAHGSWVSWTGRIAPVLTSSSETLKLVQTRDLCDSQSFRSGAHERKWGLSNQIAKLYDMTMKTLTLFLLLVARQTVLSQQAPQTDSILLCTSEAELSVPYGTPNRGDRRSSDAFMVIWMKSRRPLCSKQAGFRDRRG